MYFIKKTSLQPGRFFFLPQERVVCFFETDSGFRTVAGVHGVVVGQGKKSGSYALVQRVIISGRQVRTANTFAEKHIAGNNISFGMIYQANASVGMAGGI